MEIQTLTFAIRGMTERQAFHYVESLRLGMSEFDGLVRHARSRRSMDARHVVFCAWKDGRSVAAFRQSELYARFALSPNVVGLHDHLESVYDAVDDEASVAA